jgi:hypothetical protein
MKPTLAKLLGFSLSNVPVGASESKLKVATFELSLNWFIDLLDLT